MATPQKNGATQQNASKHLGNKTIFLDPPQQFQTPPGLVLVVKGLKSQCQRLALFVDTPSFSK